MKSIITSLSHTLFGIAAFYLLGLSPVYAELFPPSSEALDAMESNFLISVENDPIKITFANNFIATKTAVIIHPGANVDPRAYAPIARRLTGWGYTIHIMKTPSELVVAGVAPSMINTVIQSYPKTKKWVLAGHSVGGVAAALYIYENPQNELIKGLALWASYANPAWSIADRNDLKVLSIYASNDCLVTPEVIDQNKFSLPENSHYELVSGGNHAQFGSYGEQEKDCAADISSLRQHIKIKNIMLVNLMKKI